VAGRIGESLKGRRGGVKGGGGGQGKVEMSY